MPTGIWLYSYIGLWIVLVLNSLVLLAMIRQVLSLHGYWVRNDPEWGLPLESLAPALPAVDTFGRTVQLGYHGGKKTLLFFVSTGCSSCKRLMERIPTFSVMDGVELVVIVTSRDLQARLYAEQYRREDLFPHVPLLADPDQELMGYYKVNAVPYVVVVDEEGRVGGKGSAVTLSEIGQLIRQADELKERRNGRRVRNRITDHAPLNASGAHAREQLSSIAVGSSDG